MKVMLKGIRMRNMKKLNRILSGTLTVLFLGFIFVALGSMLATNGKDILNSTYRMDKLESYLPEDYNTLDMLNARIQSFDSQIAESMFMKEELGYLNSGFQYALGKKMITTGGRNMLTLTTGHLYDLEEAAPMEEAAQEIISLQASLPEDLPFLFVYEHPTIYDESMIPEGYDKLDHSRQIADDITGYLRKAGINLLDSRDVLTASGYSLEDLLMYTDQHWSTLSALTMAQSIAAKINETDANANLDVSLLNLDQFDMEVYEDRFLGKYGQRVGPNAVELDDLVVYMPKYKTDMTRYSQRTSSVQEASGNFSETFLREDRLEALPGKTYNLLGYTYYGQVERYELLHNNLAPDYTILLLKDSYSAPIGTFLTLMASDVISVDLRQAEGSVYDWIDKYDPDCVVMAYSLQMLRDAEYEFAQ